jgi:hypothetical protein
LASLGKVRRAVDHHLAQSEAGLEELGRVHNRRCSDKWAERRRDIPASLRPGGNDDRIRDDINIATPQPVLAGSGVSLDLCDRFLHPFVWGSFCKVRAKVVEECRRRLSVQRKAEPHRGPLDVVPGDLGADGVCDLGCSTSANREVEQRVLVVRMGMGKQRRA